MYILIAGGGKVGRQLARKLYRDKHTVAIIDRRPETCERIAQDLPDILVICGDSCDPVYLEHAGIARADVVAAVTGDDEDNLVVSQLAKENYNVRRTIARVNDSRNTPTFTALGVDVPVDSSAIITRLIDDEVSFSDMATLLTFRRGKLAIVQVKLTKDSAVDGKRVMDIALPDETVLITLLRGEEVIIPKGQTFLQAGDDVIALTPTINKNKLLELLGDKGR